MTIDPSNVGASSLIERVKNILLTPKAEWERIAGEDAGLGKLYIGYVLPLAVVGAVAMFIGYSVIGVGVWGGTFRVPLVAGLIGGAMQVVLYVGCVYVVAIIANALAPNFGSTPDQGQAHKLMAYSFTAALLAYVFMIVPGLSFLTILGLYSLYLLFVGLPVMMKTPEDKKVGYFVTLLIVGLVVFVVGGYIVNSVRMSVGGYGASPFSFGMQQGGAQRGARGEVVLPGGGRIDVDALERAGEIYAQGGGGAQAIDPERVREFLRPSIQGGYTLVATESSSAMGASGYMGTYQGPNGAEIRLTVVHMGPMGGLASMAGAMNVQQSREDSDGYSRTRTVNGRVITEEVSRSAGTASVSVIGNGVAVTGEGSGGATIEQVRGPVEATAQRMERELGN